MKKALSLLLVALLLLGFALPAQAMTRSTNPQLTMRQNSINNPLPGNFYRANVSPAGGGVQMAAPPPMTPGGGMQATPPTILSSKAPHQVTPGTRTLQGQHINDLGTVQPWIAHYDQFGRLIARTDFNAGNISDGIPSVHHHLFRWGPGMTPHEFASHIPGPFIP